MKDKEILQKIIDSEGSCNWSNPEICAKCPMSRLKFKDDGNPLSCVDALNIENVKIEDRDKVYKAAAEKVLADLAIEDIVEEK
jgi:hypothetical protein